MAEAWHGMCVLETKEPHLPQTDCLHNLIDLLLTRRRPLDRELQLSAHRSHPDIHQFASSHHLEWLFPHYTTHTLV